MATQPSLIPPSAPPEMTVEEFLAYPWPEDECWELIDGRPYMSPSPVPLHQLILSRLGAWLNASCPDRTMVLVACDVALPGKRHCLRPDLMVVDALKIREMRTGPYRGVPRLVVEILSPSTESRDLGIKLRAYASAGVPEYWIVDQLDLELHIRVLSREGSYAEQAPDADGFRQSPFVGAEVRLQERNDAVHVDRR